MKSALAGPNPANVSLELANLAALDVDVNAFSAILDPAKAKDDTYHRAYRRITIGAYTATIGQGEPLKTEPVESRIDGVTIDDVGFNPSKLQIPDFLALIQAMQSAGAPPPSPAAAKAMFDQLARIYEGIRIRRFEVSGVTIGMPQKGTVKLAAIRLSDFSDGKIGEFAIEGFDVSSVAEPVKVGRFALKSFAIADMMRTMAEFGVGAGKPGPEQLIGMLRLLEGAEISGVVAPYKGTHEIVTIETLAASWGQFVGAVPTAAHVTAKVTGPIVPEDPAVFRLLAASGRKSATVSLDVGAAWNEQARTFALTPASIEIGELLATSARADLANVSRELFTFDPLQRMIATAAVQLGPIEIVVRDFGGVELMLQAFATEHNLSPDEGRKQVLDDLRQRATELAAANPDVVAAAEAVAEFISKPRGSLTLRVTPKNPVSLVGLIAAYQENPAAALSALRIEATTTR